MKNASREPGRPRPTGSGPRSTGSRPSLKDPDRPPRTWPHGKRSDHPDLRSPSARPIGQSEAISIRRVRARLRAEGRLRIVKPRAGAVLRADGSSPHHGHRRQPRRDPALGRRPHSRAPAYAQLHDRVHEAYSIKARWSPVFLAVLPPLILCFALVPGLPAWNKLWPLLGAAGVVILVDQLGRDRGKRLEPALWASWGGAPTTAALRHR